LIASYEAHVNIYQEKEIY